MKDLTKIMGCLPGKCLGKKKWEFSWLAQSPNYVHVLSSAVAIGGAWRTWTPELQKTFEARWKEFDSSFHILALYIDLGLPGVLTYLLVYSCSIHGVGNFDFYCRGDFGALCQTCNMGFLGEFHGSEWDEGSWGRRDVQHFRVVVCILTKLPALWMKVSLLALSLDSMGWMERTNMLVAICLGAYACMPLIKFMVLARPRNDIGWRRQVRPLVNISTIWVPSAFMIPIIFVHFVGIFYCKNHDLSVYAMGCTEN